MHRACAAVFIVALTVGSAAAVDVTQCGQYVAPGETGVLQGDLVCGTAAPGLCADCTTPTCLARVNMPCTDGADCVALGAGAQCVGVGVRLGNRALLDLNGFSIAGALGDQPAATVFCDGRCELLGPGEVRGGAQWGVFGRRVRASSLTVRDGPVGITARYVKLDGVIVTGNVGGVDTFRLTADDCSFTSNTNAFGARGKSIRGTNVVASDNLYGLEAQVIRVVGITANGNMLDGVHGTRVVLDGGTVTGNGQADIASVVRPRLTGITCGSSANLSAGGTWGVCSGD
jgi:hypothetical protein